MKRITRYIGWEIAGPAVLALAVFSFIGVANELRERIEEFHLAHVKVSDFAKLTLWFMPTLLYYIVPVTYMMGIMLAFGRLAQHNEITALRAAGIPLKRLVFPVVVTGAVLSIACFFLQDRIQPMALRTINHLIYTELPRRVTMDVLSSGVMHELGDWRVYIGSKDRLSNTVRDVDILIPQDAGDLWLYHTDSARFLKKDGRAHLLIDKGYLLMPGEGVRAVIDGWDLAAPIPETRKVPAERRMLTLRELLARNFELEQEVVQAAGLTGIHELYENPTRIPDGVSINTLKELYKVHDEVRERVSLPLACLAVSLLAAPLAIRGGRGGRSFSFAIGFGVCVAYYSLWMGVQPRTLCTLGQAVFRGTIPNLVVGTTGLAVLLRVDRV